MTLQDISNIKFDKLSSDKTKSQIVVNKHIGRNLKMSDTKCHKFCFQKNWVLTGRVNYFIKFINNKRQKIG